MSFRERCLLLFSGDSTVYYAKIYHALLFDVGQCSSFSMLVAVTVILALLALLTLVLALSILNTEGDEDYNIPCQAPDAVTYVIIWAVDGAVIVEDELMGFKVGEQRAVADGIKERNITFIPTADVHSTTLTCVVADVLNVTNISPSREYIIIIQGLQ